MHDLTTIQRMNAEATEQAMTQLAEEQVLADIDAERAEAMKRHPAGKRLTEPAQDAERLTPVEAAAQYASRSALDLAEKTLTGLTRNGKLPFALSGEAALAAIALGIEADRAQRNTEEA